MNLNNLLVSITDQLKLHYTTNVQSNLYIKAVLAVDKKCQ
jgi:hypothetical protein